MKGSVAMQDLIKIVDELLEGANDATKTLSYYTVYKRYEEKLSI